MTRHPEYKYQVGKSFENKRWIHIEDLENSGWGKEVLDCWSDIKDDGPMEFILRVKDKYNWTVIEVGELQYSFIEDKLNLIFQWDDLFGFVIVVDDIDKVEAVKELIGGINHDR